MAKTLEAHDEENERDAWRHRMANLVPLHVRKNSAASNYDLATKKNVCTSRARARHKHSS
jgi:hypothetical protein